MRVVVLVALIAILLGGCGDGGRDGNAPKSVARAYYEAAFECGEQGAGRQYDLSTSPHRTSTRDDFIRSQQRRGCRPKPVPGLRVGLVDQGADYALVEVAPAGSAPGVLPDRLLLIRVDGSWKVDTSRSDSP